MKINKIKISQIYSQLASELDISEELFKRAENKYMDLARWLEVNVEKYDFEIYQQGSFALGTVIKPITDNDEYDLDIVCEISNYSDLTAEELKKRAYYWLNNYGKYEHLKERRRCWQVIYSDSLQFHIDFLPSLHTKANEESIMITDKDENSKKYEYIGSNPKGYAYWFKERMLTQYELIERSIAMQKYSSDIKRVPKYEVKTPLQKVIQLLKRHRDIMFLDDKEGLAPISIIITTLAAHAYNNEADIYDSIYNILNKMPQYINRSSVNDYVIENPSYPNENFAEKWNIHPERAQAFFEWIKQAKIDLLENILAVESINQAGNLMKQLFGENIINRSYKKLNLELEEDNFNDNSNFYSERINKLISAPHKKKLPWKLPKKNGIIIKALIIEENGNSYDYLSDGLPIKKNSTILFKAIFGGFRQNYNVRWQIVNTGYEAEKAGQLRGELVLSNKGANLNQEYAQYKGSHFVQCFVTKNNECKLKSDYFIINIE